MPAVATPFEDEAKEPRGCVESDEEAEKRSTKRRSPTLEKDEHVSRKGEGSPSTGRSAVGELNRSAALIIMTVIVRCAVDPC